MRTRAAAAVGLLVTLALSSCSSDTSDGADPSTPPPTSETGTQTTSPVPSTPPTAPTTPTVTPTVTPASGPDLLVRSIDGPVLRVSLPAGADWSVDDDFASVFLDAGPYDVSGGANLTAPGKGFDYYAKQRAQSIGQPVMERQADRTVNGVEGFVIEGRNARDYVYVFGTVYEDSFVTLMFDFPTPQAPTTEWIDSILASAEWL